MRTDHRIRWTYSEGGSRHSEGGLTEEQALKLYRILNRAFEMQLARLEWIGPDGNRIMEREGNKTRVFHPAPEYTGEW
jgi:hypothetical protein